MTDQWFILVVALALLVDQLLHHSAAAARRRERQRMMIDRLIDFTPRFVQIHEDWQEQARRERKHGKG